MNHPKSVIPDIEVTHPLVPLARAFESNAVRYTLIGVSGANLYGPMGQAVFTTEDFDFFLPIDPENLLQAWDACNATNLKLWLDNEPLDRPHDRWLAERVTQRPRVPDRGDHDTRCASLAYRHVEARNWS